MLTVVKRRLEQFLLTGNLGIRMVDQEKNVEIEQNGDYSYDKISLDLTIRLSWYTANLN